MTETQSFMNLLSTNLAHVFHRYLFVKNKQICSHQFTSNRNLLTTNSTRKVRINMGKYGHLFNRQMTSNLHVNDNKLAGKDNVWKKHKKKISKENTRRSKIKSKTASIQQETERQESGTITTQPSTLSSTNKSATSLSEDSTSKTEDHHPSSSTPSTTSKSSMLQQKVDSTLDISEQCREKLRFRRDMKPAMNKNYMNTQQLFNEFNSTNTRHDRQRSESSKGSQPKQFLRGPKESRSKRRACCGGKQGCQLLSNISFVLYQVYYDLFHDTWRILQGWFTIE